jgi:hypothetical protein
LPRKLRESGNRQSLTAATARYFEELGPRVIAEENCIAHGLASAAGVIDFDNEL